MCEYSSQNVWELYHESPPHLPRPLGWNNPGHLRRLRCGTDDCHCARGAAMTRDRAYIVERILLASIVGMAICATWIALTWRAGG